MTAEFWQDLASAFCLMLVLEGMMPFISPGRWRHLVQVLACTDDRTLRVVGLVCMLVGALALYWVR